MVTVGETAIETPAPLDIPPHELEYHFQEAPIPRLPPVKLRVVVDPLQINGEEEVAETAAVEGVLTPTVIDFLDKLLHVIVYQVIIT